MLRVVASRFHVAQVIRRAVAAGARVACAVSTSLFSCLFWPRAALGPGSVPTCTSRQTGTLDTGCTREPVCAYCPIKRQGFAWPLHSCQVPATPSTIQQRPRWVGEVARKRWPLPMVVTSTLAIALPCAAWHHSRVDSALNLSSSLAPLFNGAQRIWARALCPAAWRHGALARALRTTREHPRQPPAQTLLRLVVLIS